MNLADKPLRDVTLRELVEAMLFVSRQQGRDYDDSPQCVRESTEGASEYFRLERERTDGGYPDAAKESSRPLAWTQERPTAPGVYYIYDPTGRHALQPVQVCRNFEGSKWWVLMLGNITRYRLDAHPFTVSWWCGPLQVPLLPTGATP